MADEKEREQSIHVNTSQETRKLLLNLSRRLDLSQAETIEKALELLDQNNPKQSKKVCYLHVISNRPFVINKF